MMKHLYYEIKKILSVKFVLIYFLVIVIGALSFYMSLDKCMDELHIRNIRHMIDIYGNEKTYEMREKLLSDYIKSREILGQEDINREKLLNGEMSHIEYSEYTRLAARIKSYEKAWQYVLDKHYTVEGSNGYIIVTEYWNCYLDKSLLHPGNILLFLLITGILVAIDKRRGMESVLAATYIGEKKIRINKGIVASLLVGCSVLLLQVMMLGIMWYTDRMDYINAPMNSLAFYNKDIEFSIGVYLWIHILAISLIYAISSGIIVTLFSRYGETENVTKERKA